MTLEAIILDLGNVLAFHDNELLFREMSQVFGTSPEAMRTRLDSGLWDKVNRGHLKGEALRTELVTRLGREVSPERWFEVWNCHFTIHHQMVELVEQLVGRVRLVLLSNTHDQHVAWLRPRLPVLEKFDGLVLSYEVGLIKPERGIYEKALEVAKVDASRAVFFDDVERYAQAAEQVGIKGRVFTTAQAFRSQLAELGFEVSTLR